MADSDGLAIATQDTIHPPKILGKSKCMSNAILAILAIRSGLCFICTPSAILQDKLPCCSRPVERTRPLLSLRSSNISPIFTKAFSSRRWLLGRWSCPPGFSAHIHKTLICHRMIGLCLLKQSHRSRMCSLASSLLVYISGFSQIRIAAAYGCSVAGLEPAFLLIYAKQRCLDI